MATLFFDLGNVLLFFSFSKMFRQMSDLLGVCPDVLQREIINSGLGIEFEKGKIDSQIFHARLCQLALKNVSMEALSKAASDIFIPNWPMVTLLIQLKNHGHRLLLLSNTNEMHFLFAKEHYKKMFVPFDDFVLSYEVGYAKPELEIYFAALAKTNSPPSECFYIDDIAEFIEAAREAGIPGIQFTGIDLLKEELRSRGYLE